MLSKLSDDERTALTNALLPLARLAEQASDD
jgi:hypothetical protein